MTEDSVPPELRYFILRYFDTITEIEGMLLLRANPDRGWTIPDVTSRLYTDEHQVASALRRLCDNGLLECNDGVFRFHSSDTALCAQIDTFASFYATHLIPITNLVHDKLRRVREFAGAFRFRRER